MIKKLLVAFAITAFFTTTGCTSKDSNTNIPGMSQYDLSSLGTPITINVPDTTKTQLEVISQGSGSVMIKSGKDFQLIITPGEGDFQLKKDDLAVDDVKKLKRYVTEEPTLLIWESQISGLEPEFHFYTSVKVGNDSYVVENIKENDIFSEAAIKKMVEATKSIKATEAGNS